MNQNIIDEENIMLKRRKRVIRKIVSDFLVGTDYDCLSEEEIRNAIINEYTLNIECELYNDISDILNSCGIVIK